jgi:hypothetical protein
MPDAPSTPLVTPMLPIQSHAPSVASRIDTATPHVATPAACQSDAGEPVTPAGFLSDAHRVDSPLVHYLAGQQSHHSAKAESPVRAELASRIAAPSQPKPEDVRPARAPQPVPAASVSGRSLTSQRRQNPSQLLWSSVLDDGSSSDEDDSTAQSAWRGYVPGESHDAKEELLVRRRSRCCRTLLMLAQVPVAPPLAACLSSSTCMRSYHSLAANG